MSLELQRYFALTKGEHKSEKKEKVNSEEYRLKMESRGLTRALEHLDPIMPEGCVPLGFPVT